jgi:hypothetical protein
MYTCIDTTHVLSSPTFYQIDLAIRNTVDVADGKPITVRSGVSGMSANNPLGAFDV